MKKLLVVVFMLLAGISTVNAQQFTLGARLGTLFGFHAEDEYLKTYIGIENTKSKINLNFAAYGAFAMTDKLSLQTELSFMIKQGIKVNLSFEDNGLHSNISETFFYSSLDIPLLLAFTFTEKPVLIGLLAGPHVSFPLDKFYVEIPEKEFDKFNFDNVGIQMNVNAVGYDTDGVTFGLTAGLFTKFPVGPGRIVGDIRCLLDFIPIKARIPNISTYQFFTRRGLALTLGYEFSF